MGLLDKLFGKKEDKVEKETVQLEKGDAFISADNDSGFKVIRPLTEEQKDSIEKSTILLRASQLYMHYWTNNLVCEDPNDQTWQNKVLFFWKAEEPFLKNHYHQNLKLLKLNIFFLEEILQKFHYKLDKQHLGLECQDLEKSTFAK